MSTQAIPIDADELARLDAERMRMADALREILDYPLDSDVIHAAAQMKLIAVRAFTNPIGAAIRAEIARRRESPTEQP